MVVSALEHSLALDGDGDFVDIPHDSALNLAGGNGLTVEAWIHRASTDGCHTIISKGYQTAYALDVCTDVRLWSAGSGQSGTTQVPAGVWTHVAAVQWPDNQVNIYINGELDYSGTAAATPSENTTPVFIGAEPPPAGDLSEFAGNIAEVRLWNVARDQNAIRRTMHVALDVGYA